MIKLYSFGFKYRTPPCNNYIDVSFIKNPAREKHWGLFSEINEEMQKFVLTQKKVSDIIESIVKLILLLNKVDDGIRFGIGCNAGRHRSPIVVEKIAEELKNNGIKCSIEHLEK